jgi:poly(A) polymerase
MNPKRYSKDKHPLRSRNIDPDAYRVIERLAMNGYSAYIVGGGVRDILLGRKPKDFDIATDATPRKIKSLFSNSRIIGRRFKLAQIFFGRQKLFEVSTFRDATVPSDDLVEDPVQTTDDNVFGTEETDARRRDITINGLYFDPISCTIIDYVGGMEDLHNRVIRIIGNPDVRIIEDPVRMIRVVRHAARAGFDIDPETFDSVLNNRALLAECPPVRVFDEFRKDLLSGHFLKIIRLLAKSGLLQTLVPMCSVEILDEGSPGAETLGRIDEYLASGDQVDLFLPLLVLAIFSKAPQAGRDLSQYFPDLEEVEPYLQQFFSQLAVPRRERERASAALTLFQKLFSGGVSGEFDPYGTSVDTVEDTMALCRLLPASGHDRLVHQLLKEALNAAAAGWPGEPRRRRRRRHSKH